MTPTPIPDAISYMLEGYSGTIQLTITAGEVHIANLLTLILLSVWALIALHFVRRG